MEKSWNLTDVLSVKNAIEYGIKWNGEKKQENTMAMEHVLEALKAAIDTANKAAVEYDRAKAKVNEMSNQQSQQAEILSKKEAKLKEIEALLGPAVDAKLLLEKALKAKAEADAAMKELKIRSEAFADYAQKEENNIDVRRRDQEKTAQIQKDKEENLMQREINLERLVIEKVQKIFPHQKIGG